MRARPEAADRLRRIRSRLLGWYRKSRRDLPWRRTRDPYAIWVSEVMLQQTRVETVVPYYVRFLERFPDVASLAAANEEQVLARFSGLGYYRRARALLAGARALCERHGGELPREVTELRALPGIGRYTAGAIASIAFDRAEPVVDGNVRRVLCRLEGWNGHGSDERLWRQAARLASGRTPGALNQALMELGALVCLPDRPHCDRCPLAAACRAHLAGDAERYPAPSPRRATERARVAVAWVVRRRRLLLERPAPGSPLRGSWDLPAVEIGPQTGAGAAIAAKLRGLGLDVEVEAPLARLSHAILHRRLTLEVVGCRRVRGPVSGGGRLCWVDPGALDDVAISGATRKVAARLRTA